MNIIKSTYLWSWVMCSVLYPFQSQTVLAYQPHSVLNASDFVESETSNAFYLRSPEDLFTDAPNDLLWSVVVWALVGVSAHRKVFRVLLTYAHIIYILFMSFTYIFSVLSLHQKSQIVMFWKLHFSACFSTKIWCYLRIINQSLHTSNYPELLGETLYIIKWILRMAGAHITC